MSEASTPLHTSVPSVTPRRVIAMGVIVWLAALIGIWARPIGFLSAIWPANAVLLGMLLRQPQLGTAPVFLAAFAGYVAADLMTGSALNVTLLLSLTNMAGVSAAWLLMRRRPQETLSMQRQSSALLLFIGSSTAALMAATLGSPVLMTQFGTPPWQAFSMWFSGEFFNYMVLLPVILSWPARKLGLRQPDKKRWLRAMPMLSVVALEFVSYWLGGPGALAFSLPALLWCALTYRISTLTLITAALCLSKMMAISLGSFDFTPAHFLDTVSFRIGLSMLVLGPLAVAGSYLARTELMRKLSHAVNHDFLTDVLARGAFMTQGQRVLDRCAHDGQPAAVFMLDLDHFKQVNDRFGHAGGDLLLKSFSKALSGVLRGQDIVGRMGGEEFAVVLPQLDRQTSLDIAERINQAVRELHLPTVHGSITATVSIGLIHITQLEQHHSLDALLQHADQALYEAKASGRDRFNTRLW